MTYEEALNKLHKRANEKRGIIEEETVEWLIVVDEALEKQIPKKPELWHNQPCPPVWADDDWGYKCPTCGNEDIDYPEHHCVCGQALLWEE